MEVELGKWYEVHVVTRNAVGFLMRRAQLTDVTFTETSNNGLFYFTLEDDKIITVPQGWITSMVDLTPVEEQPPTEDPEPTETTEPTGSGEPDPNM